MVCVWSSMEENSGGSAATVRPGVQLRVKTPADSWEPRRGHRTAPSFQSGQHTVTCQMTMDGYYYGREERCNVSKKGSSRAFVSFVMVPKAGLEPARLSPHAPQTCASTNSATWAMNTVSLLGRSRRSGSPAHHRRSRAPLQDRQRHRRDHK